MKSARRSVSPVYELFKRGAWSSCLIERAELVSRRNTCSDTLIELLDIYHYTAGLSVQKWLDIADRCNSLPTTSPKLLLRLHDLILTPGRIEGIDKPARYTYCHTLQSPERFSYFSVLADAFRSGYAGCLVHHYPGLLTNVDKQAFKGIHNLISCRKAERQALKLVKTTCDFTEIFSQKIAVNRTIGDHDAPLNIAAVGNSPAILEKHHGEEIDAADIVIRFNHCAVDARHRRHYGSRTDLWVMSPSTPVHYCPADASVVVVSGLQGVTRPSLYWKKLLDCDRPVAQFPDRIWYSLVRQFQAPPSAGALLLASLEALPGNFRIQCFGFSTSLHTLYSVANHHADSRPRSNRHNWLAETRWLHDHFG